MREDKLRVHAFSIYKGHSKYVLVNSNYCLHNFFFILWYFSKSYFIYIIMKVEGAGRKFGIQEKVQKESPCWFGHPMFRPKLVRLDCRIYCHLKVWEQYLFACNMQIRSKLRFHPFFSFFEVCFSFLKFMNEVS